MSDITVKEEKREVFFSGGRRAVFEKVKWFNSDGSFLRLGTEDGCYILINTDNVDYMMVDGDRVR